MKMVSRITKNKIIKFYRNKLTNNQVHKNKMTIKKNQKKLKREKEEKRENPKNKNFLFMG